MKNFLSCLVILVFSFSATFAGTTEERTVDKFESVKISGGFTVIFIQGEEGKIKVDAPEDVMSKIITEVKDGVLEIKDDNLRNTSSITIYINLESIDKLNLSGSGKVLGRGEFTFNKLDLNLSGSGNINLQLKAESIDLDLSGSGVANLSGKTNSFDADISGSGNINAEGLKTEKASFSISGSGDVKTNVTESLKAKISGSGTVLYKGEPKEKDIKISGSGSVKSL